MLCTTIGQLNFFKWAFNNNVIEYVNSKYKSISKAMGTSNKMDKTRKQKTAKQLSKKTDISVDNDKCKDDKDKDDNKDKNKDSIKEKIIEEVKVNKNGINIKAQKKETFDEIKIVLSFD